MGESSHPIQIDWSSASVEDACLTVRLDEHAPSEWREQFEAVLARLDRERGAWGQIVIGKAKIKVADVSPGAESDIRHLLESAVLQANANQGREPDGPDDPEQPSGADTEMTETFRAFAER